MKKSGRNDPCPCGSGKKFKKCCESKMIGGRFLAAKVDLGSSSQIQKAMKMTSFFQTQLSQSQKKPASNCVSEEQSSHEKEKIC